MLRNIFVFILLGFILNSCHRSPADAPHTQHAVIITYQRFGEDRYPQASIARTQFQDQINILTSNGYHVLPVTTIVDSLQQGKPLPDKTVGITIDGAYASAYTKAWPLLRAAKLPFTLMVTPSLIDKRTKGMMTWKQIHYLSRQPGVTIGIHSASHLRFNDTDDSTILADLKQAQKRLKTELSKPAVLFVYPDGDYQVESEHLLKHLGIIAAFKQVSGVITAQSDFYALPRFSINQNYGTKDRFALITQALPLNISQLSPENTLLQMNPPIISFRVTEPNILFSSISCYLTNNPDKLPLVVDQNRIVIMPQEPFAVGQTHIYCTLADKNKRWHWLGLMYIWEEQGEV